MREEMEMEMEMEGGLSEEKDLQMIVERGMKWNCLQVM